MTIAPAMPLLAQQSNSLSLAISIAALIAASILLFGVFVWLRKRLFSDHADDAAEALSIKEVRRLHREGRITDEEFAALRRAALLAAGVPAEKIEPNPHDPPTTITTGESPLPGIAQSQPTNRAQKAPDGGLRAPPGYDLTGEPLPGRDEQPPGG